MHPDPEVNSLFYTNRCINQDWTFAHMLLSSNLYTTHIQQKQPGLKVLNDSPRHDHISFWLWDEKKAALSKSSINIKYIKCA